jgi:hypothetical protein
MQLTDITRGRVALELDRGDCLALAQACRAQVMNAATPNYEHAATLCVAFEALGMAAFAMDDPQPTMGRELLWATWGPKEGRELGSGQHTGLDGEPVRDASAVEDGAEKVPACAEKGA